MVKPSGHPWMGAVGDELPYADSAPSSDVARRGVGAETHPDLSGSTWQLGAVELRSTLCYLLVLMVLALGCSPGGGSSTQTGQRRAQMEAPLPPWEHLREFRIPRVPVREHQDNFAVDLSGIFNVEWVIVTQGESPLPSAMTCWEIERVDPPGPDGEEIGEVTFGEVPAGFGETRSFDEACVGGEFTVVVLAEDFAAVGKWPQPRTEPEMLRS